MVGTPSWLKQEQGLKTPITPPVAYVDFLKALSPTLMSPLTSTSQSFAFSEKSLPSASFEKGPSASDRSTPATSQPPLSRTVSSDSTVSDSSNCSCKSKGNTQLSKLSIPPPSPFARPSSARTPRHIQIPQSPYMPASVRSPMSATSVSSPYTTAPYSAAMSPRDWDLEAKGNGKSGKVSVRQVVTRTVTYSKTPIDPAPKGKRRKVEESTDG
ncbi:hypothetical protein B0A49_08710 [Cryomyces minteri]|uniref:Uncharacterized protein n=1 Tax=Cryomyces minteri TaxID=331657 RepID=A0A4U0X1G8_9PEZI|nr:hypothetical protein B0A49_08710 [Cryomyces minteri]